MHSSNTRGASRELLCQQLRGPVFGARRRLRFLLNSGQMRSIHDESIHDESSDDRRCVDNTRLVRAAHDNATDYNARGPGDDATRGGSACRTNSSGGTHRAAADRSPADRRTVNDRGPHASRDTTVLHRRRRCGRVQLERGT